MLVAMCPAQASFCMEDAPDVKSMGRFHIDSDTLDAILSSIGEAVPAIPFKRKQELSLRQRDDMKLRAALLHSYGYIAKEDELERWVRATWPENDPDADVP